MSATTQLVPNEKGPGREQVLPQDLDGLRRAFAEDGYLIFRNVVSREQLSQLCARILDEFERSKRSGRLFSGGGLITGHLNCFPGEESRFAYDALQEHGIIDLIKAIFLKHACPMSGATSISRTASHSTTTRTGTSPMIS